MRSKATVRFVDQLLAAKKQLAGAQSDSTNANLPDVQLVPSCQPFRPRLRLLPA
jgi:hypothetical protein